MADKQSDDIIDIVDSPDVAVWAKETRRKNIAPDSTAKFPKSASMSLYYKDKDGKKLFVDAANEKDVERATKHASLTDEAEYVKQE